MNEQLTTMLLNAMTALAAQASWATTVAFFFVAYAFTWTLHGAIVLFHLPFERTPKSPAMLLYFVGLAGPLTAALLLAQLSYGEAGVVSLLSGALRWDFGAVWYVMAIVPLAGIYLVSAVAYRLRVKERFALFRKPPVGLLVLVVSQVWVVIAEEFGWRGFALPHLQALLGWLVSGLVLGVLWASWHLPMFFVSGSNQYGSSFPRYLFVVTVWSLYMAMLYYQTGGSVLACMIFHAAANIWGMTINVPEKAEGLVLLLCLPLLITAVALLPM